MQKTSFIPLIFLLVCACVVNVHAQINVQQGVDASVVIERLVGKGVVISNVVLVGNQAAFGKYKRIGGDIPLDSGIVITTGLASNAQGVNNNQGISQTWNIAGDADLDAIVQGQTFDACTIAFDIKPVGKKLVFKYTFGSDEYNEYVNDIFNDVFAFLITGQNPVGGSYNKKNIALIPNTTTPVTIKTINNNVNNAYFQDNTLSNSPGRQYMQYDGYTKSLFVEVDVVPCAVYRLELKIADVGDAELDSGVFIEQITSIIPKFEANLQTDYNGLIEGCAKRPIQIVRKRSDFVETMRLDAEGTAVLGQDYDLLFNGAPVLSLPIDITMNIGDLEKNFVFVPKADAIYETTEKVTFYLEYGCNFERIDNVSANILEVNDFKPLSNSPANNASMYRCGDDKGIILESFSGKSYAWTSPDGNFTCLDADCKKIQTAKLNTSASYNLTLKIEDCTFSQSITIGHVEGDSLVEKASFCPFPPRQFEVFTNAEETTLLNAGRVLRYEWTNTTGVSHNKLIVQSEEEKGVRVCQVFDNISGCSVRYKRFEIDVNCTPIFEIPTAFTPNADGLNDALKVIVGDVAKLEIKFFNRWGECVHIIYNKQEIWDGTLRGKALPEGVYVWQASYATPLQPNKYIKKQGRVQIIK